MNAYQNELSLKYLKTQSYWMPAISQGSVLCQKYLLNKTNGEIWLYLYGSVVKD